MSAHDNHSETCRSVRTVQHLVRLSMLSRARYLISCYLRPIVRRTTRTAPLLPVSRRTARDTTASMKGANAIDNEDMGQVTSFLQHVALLPRRHQHRYQHRHQQHNAS